MSFHDYVLGLGSCVLWQSYRLGHINDLSPSGLPAVFSNGQMQHGAKGHAYLASGGTPGGIVVADTGASDPLRLTEGTLMVFVDGLNPTVVPAAQRLLSKRDGGGSNYGWYVSGSNTIDYYDGVSVKNSPAIDQKLYQIAINIEHGAIPSIYGDGLYIGDYSAAVSVVQNDAALQIGRYYTNIRNLEYQLHDALIFNAQLTATEIGKINELWHLAPTSYGHRRKIYQVQLDTNPSLVAQYGRGRTPDGKWSDMTGGGNNATIKNGIVDQRGVYENDLMLDGIDGIVPIQLTTLLAVNAGTFAGWCKTDASGRFALVNQVTGTSRIYTYGTGGAFAGRLGNSAAMVTPYNAQPNTYYFIALTWDGSTGVLYINGTLGVTAPYISLTATTPARIGLAGATVYQSVVSDCRFFSEALSADAIRAIYLQGARHVLLSHPRLEHPVDVASVSLGKCGPWSVLGGAFKWSDDGSRRQLACSTAGDAWCVGSSSFGTYRFGLSKGADANTALVLLFGEKGNTTLRGTNQKGYAVGVTSTEQVAIYRVNGAVLTAIGTTAAGYVALSTRYQFHVDQAADGVFRVWVEGGAYSTPTLAITTASDLTYTAGNNVVAELDAGDVLDNVEVLRGPMTPTEYYDL